VLDNGLIIPYAIDTDTGKLSRQGKGTDARGTSTCYITLDKAARNMLIVNYWDASIHVFGIEPSGKIGAHRSKWDPNEGRTMVAKPLAVNHSENDAKAQKERQADPHSHAIILDPFFGQIAYVPDLGQDSVRQFLFDPDAGSLQFESSFPSGAAGSTARGPRYIEFHPTLPVAYVVNELSSEVAVFQFDRAAALELIASGKSGGPISTKPTLKLVQNVSTIPKAWPRSMNTCGRITVHKSGDYVLCSNRGHDSIASFHVHHDSSPPGLLSLASIQHTHGATPRHFAFDPSGQWLLAANQDSDSVSVFRFNQSRGSMEEVGKPYAVPSPNFVCVMKPTWTVPQAAAHPEAKL
jgi:6-phosphogluconolactonase (cycloisomerase 2 family)